MFSSGRFLVFGIRYENKVITYLVVVRETQEFFNCPAVGVNWWEGGQDSTLIDI